MPYIGIYGTTVTAELEKKQGMPSGVYVVDVDPDSPAMEAGIQSGDIICQVGDDSVSSIMTYQSAVLKIKAGGQVTVRGMRLGGRRVCRCEVYRNGGKQGAVRQII